MSKKTFTEQIADLEATRAAKMAELNDVTQKSVDEERSMDEDEREQFDELTDEVKQIDADLKRLRQLEKLNASKAVEVDGSGSEGASESRGGKAPAYVRSVKNEEPGIGFARLAMAMWAAKGNLAGAKAFAESKFGSDTRLQSVMKAAVEAGTTTNPTWAGALADYRNLSSEFVDVLRPETILGQFGQNGVPSLRRVPFNVRIPGKTASGTARWVGEGARKPVTSSAYAATEFRFAKVAGISVITDELERFSDPSVQLLVRDDLRDAIAERLNIDFVDPAKTAGTGDYASPASITNGATTQAATADAKADLNWLWGTADAANLPVANAVYITTTAIARSLAGMENAVGARMYPNVSVTGGNIDGVPVIVSNHVPAGVFILAFASEIYLADDGVATIDVSREATLIMDDDPNALAAGNEAPNPVLTLDMIQNMFQENKLAIRAERYANWARRRPQAVSYLTGVAWS